MLHVWNIYVHLAEIPGKCRYSIHGAKGVGTFTKTNLGKRNVGHSFHEFHSQRDYIEYYSADAMKENTLHPQTCNLLHVGNSMATLISLTSFRINHQKK